MAREDESTSGGTVDRVTGEAADLTACLDDASSFVVTLVSFVAESTGRSPREMPMLSDAVDPEAVQQLLESDDEGSTTVRFEYAGCEVTVTGAGEMFVLT
jgi:hypothetical protein